MTVNGQLFYADGTRCCESHEIMVNINGGYHTGRSDDDGRFEIDVPGPRSRVNELLVDGLDIPRGRRAADHTRFLHVVLPEHFGRGGDRGGVIAGRVVNQHGDPVADTTVTADVVSNSMFFALSGSEQASTRTGSKGQFVLRFDGGTAVKNLYVGGDSPESMTVLSQQRQLAGTVDAGVFDLQIVRRSRLFGLF